MGYVQNFIGGLLKLSFSERWEDAKEEWTYQWSDTVYGSNCICGHEVHEVNWIKNIYTGADAQVGSCCVRKIMKDSKVYDDLTTKQNIIKGIQNNPLYTVKDLTPYIGDAVLEWDLQFYLSLGRKRKLSTKQMDQKVRINYNILKQITKQND